MSDPAVRWDSIEHAYEDQYVLRHLSSELKAGDCRLLAGANGSGKTTLLRIVAGLLRPTAGTLTWFGAETSPDDTVRARLGYLGHGVGLYSDLTGRENLQFFGRLYDAGGSTIDRLLAELALAGRADEPIRSYSRGMKQRLAIARTFVHAPELVLLDEPFTGLDAAGADALEAMLARHAGAGGTVLFTSHRLDRAVRVANGATVVGAAGGGAEQFAFEGLSPDERAARVLSAIETPAPATGGGAPGSPASGGEPS